MKSLVHVIKSKEDYNNSFDNILSIIDECTKDQERVTFTTQIRCFEDEIQIDTDKICICLNHDAIMYYLGRIPSSEKDIKLLKPTKKNIKFIISKLS